ncbi:hypothetical protein A1Q2_06526 [Trichosporon asahii var. asahii CBS 8904]|uniref:Macro domain-containing protein n=2 Tax=Trichosporon asahii var. asahii TaxID=189963 RepID=K1VQX1_TRIAC|nr:hypothetical protein A1Q1_02585 [Trichosporon asahii var. asahii CBS 2479]EJT48402.1 hypothetical protein A1Q1_02585 [Trichosporon asahii var. asahii CBS 2479]EKC99122.1 hypothetical protein A1Q2_06526 [Trichosporon asahii var. asahii CBS 8904]
MLAAARVLPVVSRLPLRATVRLASTTSVMMPIEPKDIPTVSKQGLGKRLSIWRAEGTRLTGRGCSKWRPAAETLPLLTRQIDMIVNAANKSLLGGGGVDGAIHRAAGPDLLRECRGLRGADTGEVKVTKGYELPAKYIAHAVGPIYSESMKEMCAAQLENCYRSALEQCSDIGCTEIAFPSISTGIYGYPIEDATEIAIETTKDFLEKDDKVSSTGVVQTDRQVKQVVFCVFSPEDEEVYKKLVKSIVPTNDA